jgi:hypothetical protein
MFNAHAHVRTNDLNITVESLNAFPVKASKFSAIPYFCAMRQNLLLIALQRQALRHYRHATTNKHREHECGEKPAPAILAVKKMGGMPRRGDWKKWVAGEIGLDQRFMTQADNRRKLEPPPGES